MQELRFKAALDALSDAAQTTVVLVTRPDQGAIAEAAHTAIELRALGLSNQRLAVNGVFHATLRSDAVACAIEDLGQQALDAMPAALRALPQDHGSRRAGLGAGPARQDRAPEHHRSGRAPGRNPQR